MSLQEQKRMSVTNLLIILMSNMGMDVPQNIEDIVDYVYKDICETADPVDWNVGDVAIGFRRWIEAQGNVQQYPYGMKDSNGKQITLGSTLRTVKEVRYLMEDLDDNDIVRLETSDSEGNVQDLYPMSMDVIENVRLTNDTNVREVRFCQRPQ